MQLAVNGQPHTVRTAPQTALLWVLRDHLQLTGTKYGCGIAQCGACTVQLNGQAVRSCVVPAQQAAQATVTTIEHLSHTSRGRALRQAWVAEDVAQCGYCQSGMLMAADALLAATPRPTDSQIDAAITNLCRCGTYARVRLAIHAAARALGA